MQLHPRENFTVVRQIEDHTDSATYYVRAVIRNAKTDAVIETLDLDDKGDQRFSKNWLVPVDASGQGFWVSILTSVYTDAGYTTKSPNYGDKMETYLIQERVNTNLHQVVGGGPDIDYKRIQKMIDASFKSIIGEIPKTDLSGIATKIDGVKTTVESIRIPEIPKTDLSPVLSAVKRAEALLAERIEGIEFPEQIPTDLSGVLEKIDTAIATNKEEARKIGVQTSEQKEEIVDAIREHLEKNTSRFNKIAKLKKFIDEELSEEPEEITKKPQKPVLDPRITKILGNR